MEKIFLSLMVAGVFPSLSGADEIQSLKETIRKNPDDAEAHNNLGAAYERLGKIREAATEFKEALRIKPDFAEAHYNLGNSYLNYGKDEEAVAEFKEAIRIKPGYADAHYNLGNFYHSLGRYQESIAAFKEVIRTKPDYADAHCFLGANYDSLKDGSNAILHLTVGVKLFEKAGDIAKAAQTNKDLRGFYAKYGHKPEDSAPAK